GDVSGCYLSRFAVPRNPIAGRVVIAVGLTQAKQHQFFARVQMQRKPVPSALIRGERLAAPFPVHPCLTGDLYRSIVDGDAARRLEIRLAKIIRGLSALRFFAVAGLAL